MGKRSMYRLGRDVAHKDILFSVNLGRQLTTMERYRLVIHLLGQAEDKRKARKLDPRFGYLGAVLDIIQITNDYLGKHDPDLRDEMEAHWPAISGKNQRDRHQGIPYGIR